MKKCSTVVFFYICVLNQWAFAGMPSYSLTDIAKIRLSGLSFFLVLFLIASFVIYKIWNALSKEFTKMPALTFKKSLGLVFLWGLAFHLLLLMIAGTRELMTPDAWVKDGLVYKVKSASSSADEYNRRSRRLELLWAKLSLYAGENNGVFPRQKSVFDDAFWEDTAGYHYVYRPGLNKNAGMKPLVYESSRYGDERFVLMANGVVELLSTDQIMGL